MMLAPLKALLRFRRATVSALALVAVVAVVPASAVELDLGAGEDPPVVLVYGGTYGFRHPSVTTGELTIARLGLETGAYTAIVTENPADLNPITLSQVDAVAWVSTTGKQPFTEVQRDAIIRFAACGGGTVAFHAAADANYAWAEYAELIGAQFDSHPLTGEADILVEEPDHPITAGWEGTERFTFNDEYYRWRTAQGFPGVSLPRNLPDTDVLLSMDEDTIPSSIQEGPTPYEPRQPIAWTRTFRDGGRVYYNNMGHYDGTWGEPEFQTSIVNGIEWVAEERLDQECFASDEPLPPPPGPPAPDPEEEIVACDVPDVAPLSGFTWTNSGPFHRLTEDGHAVSLHPGVPAFAWGAQYYMLDLSETGAATADVTFELAIPPTGDYDLSVSTGWGWYGEPQPVGTLSQTLVVEDVPHCAVLQAYAENGLAVPVAEPELTVTVEPTVE